MNDDSKLLDSNQMYRKLMEVGEQWSDKKAAYSLLESTTKSVLADLTRNHLNSSDPPKSRVEAEMEALASTAYRQHLDAVGAAHKAFLRSQVRYESLKTLVELRRSEESTRRAEMQL